METGKETEKTKLDEKNPRTPDEEEAEMVREAKLQKSSQTLLLVAVLSIVVVIGIFILLQYTKPEVPKTIDELHQLNIDGKLPEEQGLVYRGFSFVYLNGLWHTQSIGPNTSNVYSLYFHYLPTDLEYIPVEGSLNRTLFDSYPGVYVTFNPIGTNLQYVALAISKFDQTLTKALGKLPIAACDRNETEACKERPIITCNTTNKPTLFVDQQDSPKVIFEDNCIIVQGKEDSLVKAMERLLYLLYGIMQR